MNLLILAFNIHQIGHYIVLDQENNVEKIPDYYIDEISMQSRKILENKNTLPIFENFKF